MSNEQKHQTNEKQHLNELEKKQNQSNSNFLSYYIRNHLSQQQKDTDKLFLKQNVKFNEMVTEMPKRSKTLNKNNSNGLKSESDKNHFITSNLSSFNKNQESIKDGLINKNKNLSDLNKNSSRGQIYFQFEKKKDNKNTKRSTSTLGKLNLIFLFKLL